MYKVLLKLFIALFGLASIPAYGDSFFQKLDTKSVSIHSMFKDHTGLLWVGTSKGLMTYPQLLSNFPTDYKRPHDLSIIIQQIREDNLGRLWLRTQANHALVYNPHTNEIITDVEHYLQDKGLQLWYEFLLETDEKGRVWFYKDNRFLVYDFKTGERFTYTYPSASGQIVDVVRQQDRMYVVTEHHLYRAQLQQRRICSQQLATFPEAMRHTLTRLKADKHHNIWLTVNDKLMRFDIARHQWTTYGLVPANISGIQQDNNGKIIVATSNNGLFTFDEFGNFYGQTLQIAPLANGLSNNHIQYLYADQQTNTILIAYNKSNFSLLSHGFKESSLFHIQNEQNHYVPEDVISLFPLKNGNTWAGTEDNGIYLLDEQGNQLRNLFPGSTATAVLEDSKGKVWAGLYGKGLFCNDGRHFFFGQSPYNIIEVSPSRFFVNLNGGGIFAFNPETGLSQQIATENVWIMDIRRYGGKIFGATPLFLYIIDERTLKIEKIPASRFNPDFGKGIKTLMVDHRGWVWMVNYMQDSPVTIYDYPHRRVIEASELSQFTIRALAEDKKGNVWCSTDNELIRVSISQSSSSEKPRFQLVTYGNPQNLLGNERAGISTSDGRLLFGTTTGLFQFYPQSFSAHRQAHQPAISPLALASLRINDVRVSPGDTIGDRVLFIEELSQLKELSLKAGENNLRLEFRPRSIMSWDNQVWVYKLEGQTDYFMQMSGNVVTLSNIPPGTYRLILAQEINGKVTGKQYPVLTLHIAPPFYASTWAIIVYILLVILICYVVYRFNYNRQQYRLNTQRLRMKAEQEEQLNEMKLDFFTNISHEFRTPLTMILAPLDQLLKEPEVEGKLRDTLQLINQNARHLFELINQLLDFRRLGTTRPELHAQLGDLQEFVVKLCRIYDLQASLHHITFDYDYDDFHRLISFDAMKMEKIVNNLLSNAFKYTPDGGTIRVTVTGKEGMVHLLVADTGQGIKDGDKPHVFDRYYRGANHLGDSYSSGVGLHVVREYVELHKGTVTVSDNQPAGTIFDVALPLAETAAQKQLPFEEEEKGVHDHTLLLVEDNTDMLTFLYQQLSRDYRVLRATDGNMALEVLKEESPDVIISDVMMAGMDGLTLCKMVKGDINMSHIPVILLTAKALDEDELRGLQMGANDYITKPFNLDVLRERIRLQIERRETIHKQIEHHEEIEPKEVAVTALDELFIKDAIACVERNMGNFNFTVADLCKELGMNRTNVYKKMQFITGKTPLQFIRLQRLKRAHELMSQGNVRASQVSLMVGFGYPNLFARYFKEEYGIYPSDFIKEQEARNHHE